METQKQGLTCRRRLCMMLAEEKMNQTLIERYIGLRLLRTFLVVTLVFTLVVWLIQTLNLIDNIGGKGTTIIGFLGISLLGIPSLLSYILPPALLIAVLTQMIRLLQDHEYFALSAAGFSPRRLLQPHIVDRRLSCCHSIIAVISHSPNSDAFFAATEKRRE